MRLFRNLQPRTFKSDLFLTTQLRLNTRESSQGCFLRFKIKWILGRICPPDERFISFPLASIRPSPTIWYWANNKDAHVPMKSMWCPRALVKYKSAARNWNWNGKKEVNHSCAVINGLCNAYTPCTVDIRSICARLLRPEAQRAAFWVESYMGTVSALPAFSLSSLSKSELHFYIEHLFCHFYI